jgi:hypothetical protein
MTKTFFLTVILTTAAWAQPPAGMSDFLPLSIGNRWLYDYYHESYAYTENYSDRIDSGRVEVAVTGVTVYQYYKIWHLLETADYRTQLWQHGGGVPSQDSIVHSQLLFDVQELPTDQHVVINLGGSWIFRFVFPYDTSTIFRYAVPSTLDLKRYSPPTAYNSGATYQRSLVFRAAVGVDSMGYAIKYSISSGNVGAARLVEYALEPATIPEDRTVPRDFSLEQNYPNPFNPTTGIRFQVPSISDVKISVFDLLGREVAVLVNERKGPGSYEVKFDGSGVASGVYFYRLQAGNFVQSKKLLLLK